MFIFVCLFVNRSSLRTLYIGLALDIFCITKFSGGIEIKVSSLVSTINNLSKIVHCTEPEITKLLIVIAPDTEILCSYFFIYSNNS